MIRREPGDEATRLVLDRPEHGNALDEEALQELAEALDGVDGTVVLAGAGDAFCTGGDLEELARVGGREEDARRFAERLVGAFEAVERHPAPVVAAVDGAALGGGFELVTAADLAVAAEGAAFGLPETRLGLTAPLTVERIGTLAGKKRGMRFALTAERVDGVTAADWGVVNEAVPPERVDDAVREYVEALGACDDAAVAATKRRAVASYADETWRDRAVEAFVERLTDAGTRDRLRRAAE